MGVHLHPPRFSPHLRRLWIELAIFGVTTNTGVQVSEELGTTVLIPFGHQDRLGPEVSRWRSCGDLCAYQLEGCSVGGVRRWQTYPLSTKHYQTPRLSDRDRG
jgi:hypothetical protein